jgi:hypothetical protein
MRTWGIDCTTSESTHQFLQDIQTLCPDFVVIAAQGNLERVSRFVTDLAARGIPFSDIPTFVLHNSDDFEHLGALLRLGICDVIRFDSAFDILQIRMRHILADRENKSVERLQVLQDMGTHGNLEHMNVIDLLQAVGPGDKTLHVSVSAQGKQLTMFLSHGRLLFAECEGKTGADAVFEALNWSLGIWSVDQIDESDLPEANNSRTIDSILIEGCHHIDELELGKRSTEENSVAEVRFPVVK